MTATLSRILRLLSRRSGKLPVRLALAAADFLLARALLQEGVEHVARHLDGIVGLRTLGLQADLERAAVAQRGEIGIDAVGVAALVAHFLHQAGDEAATAQGVIADEQRKEIGVTALDGRQADVDVGLAGRVGEPGQPAGWLAGYRRQGGRGAYGGRPASSWSAILSASWRDRSPTRVMLALAAV